ncbi:MAG: MerR family DNA-binding transcriptional regulator [Streptosporangiaceae bacterium]
MLRIGELAELAGVTTRAIRHYHRIGLLPEPARESNGYRAYGLRDAVLLLRVSRLTELGLSLDEVADALAGDDDRELREILAELDADLAAQEQRVRARRQRIAELLAREGDLTLSAEQASLWAELKGAAGDDHPGLDRERQALELLGPLTGQLAPQAYETYGRVLADRELTDRMLAAYRRFEDLAGFPPTDPAVEELADEAAGFGDAVLGLLPDEVRQQPGDPAAVDRVFAVLAADMDPAQARCLRLMFARWRESPS